MGKKNNLIIFICFWYIFLNINSQDKISKETDYFIFSHSKSYNFWEHSNAAILIADKDSINKLKSLLFDNDLLAEYLCGYDYEILFLTNNGKEVQKKMSLNTECDFYKENNDIIQQFINSFIERIKKSPTHYIYNLKVSVDIPADSIIDEFNKEGKHLFLLSEKEDQYPAIKITYCEPDSRERSLDNAESTFNSIIQNIIFSTKPVYFSRLYRSTLSNTKYVDYTTNMVSQVYFFPTRTDIDAIVEQIKINNIQYLFVENCSEDYNLQLLDNSNMKKISDEMGKYTFIQQITEAKEGYSLENCDFYKYKY